MQFSLEGEMPDHLLAKVRGRTCRFARKFNLRTHAVFTSHLAQPAPGVVAKFPDSPVFSHQLFNSVKRSFRANAQPCAKLRKVSPCSLTAAVRLHIAEKQCGRER